MNETATPADAAEKRKRVRDRRSAEARTEARGSLAQRLAVAIFATTVVLVPFPFGSTDLYLVSIWCIALAAALVPATLLPVEGRRAAMLFGLLVVAGAFAALVLIQLSPGNGLARPDAIWQQASEVLGVPLTPSLSIVRDQPIYAAGPILAVILTVATALFLGGDLGIARRVSRVIAWSGFGYAAYGIVSAILEPTLVLWADRTGYNGKVIGTFLLANTAATFFGCHVVLWELQLLEALRAVLPPGTVTWKRFNRRVLEKPTRAIAVPFSGFVICLTALLMTGSRAGTVISLVAATLCVLKVFWNDLPHVRGRSKLVGGVVIGALLLLQIFGGTVNTRFNTTGFDDEGRWDVIAATMRIVADHPWFGSGIGTFPAMFPTYRQIPPDMTGRWERAFDTPVELASEVGLPMTGLIAALIAVGLLAMILRLRIAQRSQYVLLGGLATAGIALTHSLIDYPLQIPGLAVTVAAIGGLGVAQALRPHRLQPSPPEQSRDPDGSPDPGSASRR